MPHQLTPSLLLSAYAHGVFPMAKSRDGQEIAWYEPEMRGILPLDQFHVPRSLQKFIRQKKFDVTFDLAFEQVIRACADTRRDTWINDTIINLYTETHKLGFAHSVEVWEKGTKNLVGGVYGLSIGRAFFGESMFSTKTNASRTALVYLAARLWRRGYILLDTQFINEHLKQFGCIEIPRDEYHDILARALSEDLSFESVMDYSVAADGGASSSGASSSGASGVAGFAAGFGVSGADAGFDDVSAFLHSITQTS